MNHAAHDVGSAWGLAALVVVLLLLGYGAAVVRLRARAGRTWRVGRTVAFTAGVLAAALALSPLVSGVGDVGGAAGPTARAHMAQHVLLGMVAPLGLVLGAPSTLALAVLPVAARRRGVAVLRSRPVRVLTHPLAAGALHVGGLYALYVTPLYARTLASPTVHGLVLAHFVLAGSLFAWALVGPERAARRPGPAWRVGVLVGASAAHGYLAKLLYARAGDLPPGGHHTVAELQDAAQWMYYAGDLAEVALAVALFAGWYRRAGRRTGPPRGVLAPAR